jgi:hypothetical protein
MFGNSVSLVVQFSDYIRFMPTTGAGPKIYVTLGKVAWNVNSSANYTNGAWVLTNSANPIVPSFSPSQEAPFWKTVHGH